VYAALHTYGRTLPAGCGPTVGITGLILGGGIGLLGRKYGLTCDRLVGAQVVLPDGSVVDCGHDHEPDLFWALRGAGGGQFGVVTSLRFDTVAELQPPGRWWPAPDGAAVRPPPPARARDQPAADAGHHRHPGRDRGGTRGRRRQRRLATKYTGTPYLQGQERVVVVIEPERQTVGVG
jgi:FAD/FMN-containing dehydrogenase